MQDSGSDLCTGCTGCFLRTAIEYCSVVYHPMLTMEQENELEKLNRLAARTCFGSDLPTDDIMALNCIESLKERRIRRCDSFLRQALASPIFGPKWFPRSLGTRTGLRVRIERSGSRDLVPIGGITPPWSSSGEGLTTSAPELLERRRR